MADLSNTYSYGGHTLLIEVTFRTNSIPDPSDPSLPTEIFVHEISETYDSDPPEVTEKTEERLKDYLSTREDTFKAFVDGIPETSLIAFLSDLGYT